MTLPHAQFYFQPGNSAETFSLYEYTTQQEVSWLRNLTVGPFIVNADKSLPNLVTGAFTVNTDALNRTVMGIGQNSMYPPGYYWVRADLGGTVCHTNNSYQCDGQGFNFCGPICKSFIKQLYVMTPLSA
jgi:hypothetical protein